MTMMTIAGHAPGGAAPSRAVPAGRRRIAAPARPLERSVRMRRGRTTLPKVDEMTRSKTVLVVDDDPAIRSLLAVALEGGGYRVDTASNGAEALEKPDLRRPHAVILDATMPVMDGWEFLAHWRARPVARRAPVLVVSALGGSTAALRQGAQGFLSKPFDLDALETTLDILL